MKPSGIQIAVSNLAWPSDKDLEAFDFLASKKIEGIEVAPSRIAAWGDINSRMLGNYRKELDARGLKIPSLQAIFFSRPDAQLLGESALFQNMAEHLRHVGAIANVLGAEVAVIGAPRNRGKGALSNEDAMELAARRLSELANIASEHDIVVGMEPVPEVYNSDFLTTWQAVYDLVHKVDHPAVRVHLDTGCVSLGGGDIGEAIKGCFDQIAHFHAAQPNLGDFKTPLKEHTEAATALSEKGYKRWIAIEMQAQEDWKAELDRAVDFVMGCYRL